MMILAQSIRHGLVLLLAVSSLLPGAAMAQGSRPFEIFAVMWRGETDVEDGFRDYLDRRGIAYNLTIRNLDLDRGNAPRIVREIRRAQPHLVYTWGTGTTSSIVGKLETDTPEAHVRDIPGIFVMVAYPVEAGIIESLASTGRPYTGVTFLPSTAIQLKTIQSYGDFKNIAVIYDSTASNSRINVAGLRQEVGGFDMRLIELPIPLQEDGKPDPEQLPELIRSAREQGADLLYIGPDSFLFRHGRVYTSEAIKVGLPTFASTQGPLKRFRAMFGLVTDYYTLGKLAGLQAEKILVDKVDPVDLPIARLARYKLWVNIDVVREIGIYPPMKMISIADFKTSPDS